MIHGKNLQILFRGNSGPATKQPLEMEGADIEVGCYLIQGWLLADIGLEKVDGLADSLIVRIHGKSIAELD